MVSKDVFDDVMDVCSAYKSLRFIEAKGIEPPWCGGGVPVGDEEGGLGKSSMREKECVGTKEYCCEKA